MEGEGEGPAAIVEALAGGPAVAPRGAPDTAVEVAEVQAETEQARIAADQAVQLAAIAAEGERQDAAIAAEGERQAARIAAEEGAAEWRQEAQSLRQEMAGLSHQVAELASSLTPPQQQETAQIAAETVLEVLTPAEEAPVVGDLPAAGPDPIQAGPTSSPPPPPPSLPPSQSRRPVRRAFL